MSLLALVLASPLAAGTGTAPVPLVLARDPLPGGGSVTGIGAVHVGNYGWLVRASTSSAEHPAVVLRWSEAFFPDGGPWKQLGDAINNPPGATIGGFGSFSSEVFGGVAWVARLEGTPGGAADDEVVYFENGSAWLQEGPIPDDGFTNLPAGSAWLSFDDVRCSSNNGLVLFRGHHDDPTIAGPDETYLATGWLCGSIGVLCGVDRRVSEGETAPGLAQTIEAVRVAPGTAAMSPSGLHVVWSCDLSGDTASDGCVYRLSFGGGVEGQVLLAREGSPSPVAGRTWGALDSPAVGVNSSGTWTLRAKLDGSDLTNDAVLVKNGAVLAREGDVLPSVAPAALVGFGRGPALIDPQGRAVWYGRLSGSAGEALFRDDQVLVRTGVTQIGGRTLVRIDGGVDAMSLSPQGDELVFTGVLAGGTEGAFLLELSTP